MYHGDLLLQVGAERLDSDVGKYPVHTIREISSTEETTHEDVKTDFLNPSMPNDSQERLQVQGVPVPCAGSEARVQMQSVCFTKSSAKQTGCVYHVFYPTVISTFSQ